MKFPSLPILALWAGLSAAPEWATVEPAPSGPIHNPLKGFRPDRGYKMFSPLWRVYVRWNDLEKCEADSPQRLTSYLNDIAASAPASNVKLVPRVYLDWDGSRDDKGSPRQYWPGDLRRFDYRSDAFLARLRRLIQRMGAAWNRDPRIAYVQMGLIGYWGEMHSPSPDAALKELLTREFLAAFPDKRVLVRTGEEPFMGAGFGIYYDTFAAYSREPERFDQDPGPQVPTWALTKTFPKQWLRAPIEGEVEYNWQSKNARERAEETFGKSPDETMTVERYRRYMAGKFRRYHVSYMGWISGFNDQDPEVLAGAAALNEVLGYRFVMPRFSWTPNPSGELGVRFAVRNDGSAPFYPKWPVAVALLDPATREVRWQADLKADLRAWLPGENWDESMEKWESPPRTYEVDEAVPLPAGLKKGNYVIALAILDAEGGRQPSVRFAMKNYWKGGWHPLGFVGIGASPASKKMSGPFDELIRDETLHYDVPASLLSVKAPPVPVFTPAPVFTADPQVELIDPIRSWSLERRGPNTEITYTQDGPRGQWAVNVGGTFGPDSCLHYSSAYQEKWPPGEYALSFQMRGRGVTKAQVHVADLWEAVTEAFPLSPTGAWEKKELRFTLPKDFKKYPKLRFILTGDQDGIFSISEVSLRFANGSGKPNQNPGSTGGWGLQDSAVVPYGALKAAKEPASHPAFDRVWRAVVAEKQGQAWAAGLRLVLDRPVREGELLFLSFYARSEGELPGKLGFDFQKNTAPWTSSQSAVAEVGAEWKPFVFAFPAKIHYEVGDAKLSFLLGAQAQTLQLARIYLSNAGKGADAQGLLQGGAR
ncbi:MAG: DUF4832 domain-containing protein [Spirochaetes bacterium]|nr:DUF4832 domain-containing protein [Spirochaetota bacterium]